MVCHGLSKTRFPALWSVLLGITFLGCCIMIYYGLRQHDGADTLPLHWSSLTLAHTANLSTTECKSICSTADCINIANDVVSFMNLSADPCNDFYQYACGNFHEIYGLESNYSRYQTLKDTFYRLLKDVIETSEETHYPDSAAMKLKTVYDSCMESLELGDIPSLRLFLNQIGMRNWPNLDANFTFSNPTLGDTLGRLVTFEENMFFVFHHSGDEFYDIQIDVDHFNCTDAVKDVVVDILQNMGMDEKNIETAWESFVNVETVRQEIKQNVLEDDTNYCEDSYHHFLSCDAGNATDENIFCEVLDSMFRYGGSTDRISNDTLYFYCRRKGYIEQVSSLLKSYNHRALAHYISLRVIINNLKNMNFSFRKKLKKLLDEHFIIDKRRENSLKSMLASERSEVCLICIKKYMKLPLGFMYVAEMFSQKVIDEITVMVKKNQKVAGDFIRSQSSIPAKTRRKIIKEIIGVKQLITGVIKSIQNRTIVNATNGGIEEGMPSNEETSKFNFPEDFSRIKYSWEYVAKKVEKEQNYIIDVIKFYQNRTRINEAYETFHPLKTDFFFNFMHLKRQNFIFNHMGISTLENSQDFQYPEDQLFNVNAFWMEGIYLTFGIILPPYYKHEYPKLLNIANLGQIVAHEIGHSIYDALRRNADRDNQTRLYMEKNIGCRNAQYSSFELKRVGQKVNANKTENENFSDTVALQVTEKIVKLLFSNVTNKMFALPGVKVSSEELFYILYAQTSCAVRSKEMDLRIIEEDPHSPSEFRVNGPFQNSKRFSEVFNCSETSYMNRQEKCHVFY